MNLQFQFITQTLKQEKNDDLNFNQPLVFGFTWGYFNLFVNETYQ